MSNTSAVDFVVHTLNGKDTFYVTSEDVMARQPDDDDDDVNP